MFKNVVYVAKIGGLIFYFLLTIYLNFSIIIIVYFELFRKINYLFK